MATICGASYFHSAHGGCNGHLPPTDRPYRREVLGEHTVPPSPSPDSRWGLDPDDPRVLLALVLEAWAPGGIECNRLDEMDSLLRLLKQHRLDVAVFPW